MSSILEVVGLQVCPEIQHEIPGEEDGASEEYQALCASLGYGSKYDPKAHPLARWLQKNEVPVYPQEAVNTYLKAINMGTVEWHPMRSADKGTYDYQTVYDKAIPVEALRFCAALLEAFPGKLLRFDIGVCAKDPFLRVKHSESSESFIVAHWDEPGFSIL